MSLFDAYWPFDEPEGQLAKSVNMLRWRKMARLWCHTGVVSRHRFGEFGVIHREAGRLLLGGGGAFVNGFYGERYNWSDVATPGDDGMVKVRVESGAQTMGLFFEAWHGWHSDPHAAHGVFETPLYEVWPDGRWTDRRYLVSNEIVPGLPEIPAWVPKGTTRSEQLPSTVTVGHNATVFYVFTDWVPGYAPGRTYRATASFFDARQVAGDAGIFRVEFRAVRFADQVEVRRRVMCDVFSQNGQLRAGQGTFLLPSDNAQLFVTAQHFIPAFPTVGTPGVAMEFPAFHVRIDIHDAGIAN